MLRCLIQNTDAVNGLVFCENHLYLQEDVLRNDQINQFISVTIHHNSHEFPPRTLLCQLIGSSQHEYCLISSTDQCIHQYLNEIHDITLDDCPPLASYLIPIARTIVLTGGNQIRKNQEMTTAMLKCHLSNRVVTLTNQIILKSSLSGPSPSSSLSVSMFQFKYIYDKYNPKNTQSMNRQDYCQQQHQPNLHLFRITSTTHLIFDSPGTGAETYRRDSSISRWFHHFIQHEPFVQTLHGYLSTLILPASSTTQPPSDQLSLISSILLVGPSGSGKSALIQQEIESFLPLQGCLSLIKLSLGTLQPYSDTALIQTLNSALVRQPCVILLDNLESLTPNTHTNSGQDRETSQYANLTTVRIPLPSPPLSVSRQPSLHRPS
jgi:hypothetical protein